MSRTLFLEPNFSRNARVGLRTARVVFGPYGEGYAGHIVVSIIHVVAQIQIVDLTEG